MADRMKDYYESTSQLSLVRRMPVITRIDGHNFKSLTKHFDKPFDTKFRAAMRSPTHELVRQFQGAVFAYTQSDEISILLKDYTHLDTQAAYKNNLQKLVSLSASYATMFLISIWTAMDTRQRSTAELSTYLRRKS